MGKGGAENRKGEGRGWGGALGGELWPRPRRLPQSSAAAGITLSISLPYGSQDEAYKHTAWSLILSG